MLGSIFEKEITQIMSVNLCNINFGVHYTSSLK